MAASNKSTPTTPSLRLQLALQPHAGTLDGAWWPRTRNLEAELGDLVDHFPADAGGVERVLFSRPDWDDHPRRVTIGRGRMKTGSFPGDDTHVVVLKLADRTQLTVLVVPPETPTGLAEHLLATAVVPTNRRTGAGLLAHAATGGS